MPVRSTYVTMRDGVRLAVDAHLPARDAAPAMIQFTRYWRGVEWSTPPSPDLLGFRESAAFTALGFAYVAVDCRGSGASFGERITEYGEAEVADYGEIIDWVARQPWCNGAVATTGVSYAGNAAELAMLSRHPALRAAAPRFTDYDWYEHILFPGGARNIAFAPEWAALVRALDAGDAGPLNAAKPAELPDILGVKPTDDDVDRALRAAALSEHAGNADFWETVSACVYRDDIAPERRPHNIAEDFATYDVTVPTLHQAGWMDAGTAAGALARFQAASRAIEVVIGPWNHGATFECDPFVGVVAQPATSRAVHVEQIASFFARASRHDGDAKQLRYFTPGENTWRTTDIWPPAGTACNAFYLSADGRLSPAASLDAGEDVHEVDFTHTSGRQSRWTTSLGGGPVDYADFAANHIDAPAYVSDPLPSDVRIAGTPRISLWISSSATDGLFFAYLCAISPAGRCIYLTEGVLRALHRRIDGGRRSFTRADASPLTPGETTELSFDLHPVAARIQRGWRLQLMLAGADVDNFESVPVSREAVAWKIRRGGVHASHVTIPLQTIPEGEK